MTQKIIQVGKSAAVTLPKAFPQKIGWKVGVSVEVVTNAAAGEVSIYQPRTSKRPRLSPEFLAWVDTFIEKYRPALETLARR